MITKRIKILVFCTIVLFVSVTVIYSVGIAFGRFRTESEWGNMKLQSRNLEVVHLWGGIDEDKLMQPMPEKWTRTEDGAYELTFLLSNTNDADIVSKEPIYARIRAAVSAGIIAPESLKLKINIETQDGKSLNYDGVPSEIIVGSSLHNAFGDGWVYSFFLDKGEQNNILNKEYDPQDELLCFLQSDKLSYVKVTLHMEGKVGYTSLIQLRITATSQTDN